MAEKTFYETVAAKASRIGDIEQGTHRLRDSCLCCQEQERARAQDAPKAFKVLEDAFLAFLAAYSGATSGALDETEGTCFQYVQYDLVRLRALSEIQVGIGELYLGTMKTYAACLAELLVKTRTLNKLWGKRETEAATGLQTHRMSSNMVPEVGVDSEGAETVGRDEG